MKQAIIYTSRSAITLALAGVLVLAAQVAAAQPTGIVGVPVTITVDPIAEIEFPEGFNFTLTVPEFKLFPIKPVIIPFKVKGNGLASVSVSPDSFLRLIWGPYLGKAVKQGTSHSPYSFLHGIFWGHKPSAGDTLGYNAIVRFPVPSWHYNLPGWSGFATWLSGFASLPGLDGVGTPVRTANVGGHRHGTLGLIFIVAQQHWTADGKHAKPGKYNGTLEVTVTADVD